jgi:hypothetical protein
VHCSRAGALADVARRGRAGARVRPREPLEVRGQSLGELRGAAAQRFPERGHAAARLEELRRGQQRGLLERPDRPLVRRVERPERVDLVAEELDPDRQRRGRWEHVDDPAAPCELPPARDLEDRRVAQVEQLAQQRVLAEAGVDREAARLVRQVGWCDRVLDERLDARDEDQGVAAAPRRQGRDPGRGLVGHELAPLVGERGPRLEHGDRAGVAQPGLQLLGDAVADLGVAGDPRQALAVLGEGDRGREVRLRPVRDRRQPDVPPRRGEPLAERRERAGSREEWRQGAEIREASASARRSATPR